jgi:hypothetical protein
MFDVKEKYINEENLMWFWRDSKTQSDGHTMPLCFTKIKNAKVDKF